MALELKKDEREKPDELQLWKLKGIADAGGIGLVVTPENWKTTYEFLYNIAVHGYHETDKTLN